MYLVCLHRTIITFGRSAHYLNVKTHEDIALNLILTIIGFLGNVYMLSKHLPVFKMYYLRINELQIYLL